VNVFVLEKRDVFKRNWNARRAGVSEQKYPNAADYAVAKAMNTTLLEHILEPMRIVARDGGYAIAVHGSLARDIDLVAIPWTNTGEYDADYLVMRLAAAIASITGRCNPMNEWTDMPHGRRAKTLLVWGGRFGTVDIDLSVMPKIAKDHI
jgi:hypothetical protein